MIPNREDLRARRSAGFSLAEIILVVAVIGIAAAVSAAAWTNFVRRSETQQAARLAQKFIYQARMLSVYRGVNYFVSLDPTGKKIAIYEDTGTTIGKFDNSDPTIETQPWPPSVTLSFPPATSSMPNPLGGSAITSAWSLPAPDTSQRWSTTLKGLMATPQGVVQSAESTPATINTGVIVFADNTGQSTSVGVRGQFGSIRSFRYDGTAWKNLG